MEVSQVYQFVNDAAQESIGEAAVLAEDGGNGSVHAADEARAFAVCEKRFHRR